MDIIQHTMEWWMDQRINQERTFKIPKLNEKEKYNITKLLGHIKSNSKRNIYCSKYLHLKKNRAKNNGVNDTT